MNTLTSLILIVCVVFASLRQEGEAGPNQCQDNETCVPLMQCPSALANLHTKATRPEICGYDGSSPLVCCPEERQQVGDLSQQKCREYAKSIKITVKMPNGRPDQAEVTECTMSTNLAYMSKAEEAEFPHMVLLGYDNDDDDSLDKVLWICGGSLVSDKYVMTAAHCLISRNFGPPNYVRLGITNKDDDKYRQEFTIVERIRHPLYRPPFIYNDIALIKLNKSVEFSPQVRPACLYTKEDEPSNKLIASGWSRDAFAQTEDLDLSKLEMKLYNVTRCNQTYSRNAGRKLSKGIDDETQICAIASEEGGTNCQSSGQPLQIINENDVNTYCTYSILGVDSFGKLCGVPNIPTVYTKVSAYIEWLEHVIWSE